MHLKLLSAKVAAILTGLNVYKMEQSIMVKFDLYLFGWNFNHNQNVQ